MRSLYIRRYGGPEVLEIRTKEAPQPGSGEVRLRVARAGLNFADVTARVGLYPDAPKPPMVMGYEVAGTVDQLGPQVTGLQPGQRVMALTRFGGHSDTVVVPALQVFPIPDSVDFDTAAALPVNYLTAYHALFHMGQLRPKDRVLIHSAGGGVGLALVQLCKLVEGVEIFGTASAGKHPMLREAGVQHPIDYRTQDYAEEIRRLTNGRGVHKVLDPLGGPDWEKGYAALTKAGHLIAFGWSNMVGGRSRNFLRVGAQFLSMPRFSPIKLMQDNKSVSGINMGHLWDEQELMLSHVSQLLTLLDQGRIRPKVDKVFPLSLGAEAHRYMQDRQNQGKVLFDCTG